MSTLLIDDPYYNEPNTRLAEDRVKRFDEQLKSRLIDPKYPAIVIHSRIKVICRRKKA